MFGRRDMMRLSTITSLGAAGALSLPRIARDMLRLSAVTGLGAAGTLCLSRSAHAQPDQPPSRSLLKWTEQLPILPSASASAIGTLVAHSAQHSFHSQLGPAATFAYGDLTNLGPTLEAVRGKPARITVVNETGPHPLAASIDTAIHGARASDTIWPRIVVHLHAGNTPPEYDGYPDDTFTPGQTYTYAYPNDQQAGALWYHDHALGITRLNIQAGLAAFYLLRDADDTGQKNNPLGLPSGMFEVPLIIQDHRFNTDGMLYYPPAPWVPEFFGDVSTVNGKAWPNLNVQPALYRFRILNASNARVYNLFLSGHYPMFQIGADAGLLDAPVQSTSLLIAPAERVDILIDFRGLRAGTTLLFNNNAVAPYPGGAPTLQGGGAPLGEIMQFSVQEGAGNMLTIPDRLRGAGLWNRTVADARPQLAAFVSRQRFLTLIEIDDPSGEPLVNLLNYIYWNEADTSAAFREQPVIDTVEEWVLINLTADDHPIHIHLIQFLIQDRQALDVGAYMRAYDATGPRIVQMQGHPPPGGPTVPAGYPPPNPMPFLQGDPMPPGPGETGWKDTVKAHPGTVTRLLVPFGAKAAPIVPFGNSFTGKFVWHCHMTDHEDNDMMLPYEVVRPATGHA